MQENSLAERIKAIRVAAKDSPTEAGKKVGVSRQAYNKWEGGDTENMRLGNLLRFCDRYQVNIEALLRGDESQLFRVQKMTQGESLARENVEPYNAKTNAPLSEDEQRLLAGFLVASAETRQIMLAIADLATQRAQRG